MLVLCENIVLYMIYTIYLLFSYVRSYLVLATVVLHDIDKYLRMNTSPCVLVIS